MKKCKTFFIFFAEKKGNEKVLSYGIGKEGKIEVCLFEEIIRLFWFNK